MITLFYQNNTPPTAEWLLMRYAAGALPPYESMLMAAYLSLSPDARRQMQAFEAEGGRMIEQLEPVSVTHDCLNAVLACIDAPQPAAPRAAAATAGTDDVPAVFLQLVERHCPQQNLSWQPLAGGGAKIDITLCRSEPRHRHLRLVRLAPQQQTPQHRHQGVELTLVLQGSFADQGRSYAPGDLMIVTDSQVQHGPRAGDQGCVCMMLTEAPLRFSHPLARMLNLFWRV